MSIKLTANCKKYYLQKSDDNNSLINIDHSKYNISARHPAYKLIDSIGFDAFYNQLKQEVTSNKGLKIVKDLGENTCYELYNYKSYIPIKRWTAYSICCRGMIIDKQTKNIIALAFPKFWNYMELSKGIQNQINQYCISNNVNDQTDQNDITDAIDANNQNNINQTDQKTQQNDVNMIHNKYDIYEKLDGSLGICFYCKYSNKWRVSTRGNFISSQAIWSNKYLAKRSLNINNILIKGHTYLLEIIYKENKIGVDYGNYEGLVLLAAYNNNGYQYKYDYLKVIASLLKFKITNCYNNKYKNVNDLLNAIQIIDKNCEGFVLCLRNGFRVKFKGKEYLNMIKNKKHGNPNQIKTKIYKLVVDNGILNKKDILSKYDEEFHTEISKIYKEIYNKLLKLTEECVYDLIMTNNLKKNQLFKTTKKLNNNAQFILKARKICDQNLWKSYLGKKSNKKKVGKVINRITNELLEKKEWRMFIIKNQKKNVKNNDNDKVKKK